MRRAPTWSRWLAVLTLMLGLSACGGGGGGGEDDGNPPENQAPTASFTVSASSGPAPLAVTFNAAASADADGSIQSYAWAFGDGGAATGVSASHTYTTPGTYTARLTVTDDDGATAASSQTINVSGTPPATVRGSVVRFAANESGHSTTSVALDAETRFTVSVLSDTTDENGRFPEVDISAAVSVSGSGIAAGEFVIDVDAALGVVNAGRTNAIASFISSELLLNVDVDSPGVRAKAQGAAHFGTTLIDSVSELRISSASSYVADRYVARVRTEKAAGGNLAAYFASVNPQSLSATRQTLEAGIRASTAVFDFSDATVFAGQLAQAGLGSAVDSDIEQAAAVQETAPQSALAGDYNALLFLTELVDIFPLSGNRGSELLAEGVYMNLALDATPFRFNKQSEAWGYLFHSYWDDAGAGFYEVISEIQLPQGGSEQFEATLSPGGTLSLLIPARDTPSTFGSNGSAVRRIQDAGALVSPSSPIPLRVFSGVEGERILCNQAQCRDIDEVVGQQDDVLLQAQRGALGFFAKKLAAPLSLSGLDGTYGIVTLASAFGDGGDPAPRLASAVHTRAAVTNGNGNGNMIDLHYIDTIRRPVTGGAELEVDVGVESDVTGESMAITPVSRASLGHGQVQILFDAGGGDQMLFYGFAADAAGSMLVASTAQTCAETSGALPTLCAGDAPAGTRQPFHPDSIEHLLAVKLPDTMPTAAALAGQYLLRGMAINHYADGDTTALLLDGSTTLTLTASSGTLSARLDVAYDEIRRTSDIAPVTRASGDGGRYSGSASIDAASQRIDMELISETWAHARLRLVGFPSADGKALLFSLHIESTEAIAGVDIIDEAGVGLALATRVSP